jgi:hypothetical protein
MCNDDPLLYWLQLVADHNGLLLVLLSSAVLLYAPQASSIAGRSC